VRYNFLNNRLDRPPHGNTIFAEGTLAGNTTTVHSVSADLNSVLGPDWSYELLVGYTSRRFTSVPQGTAFPLVDVVVPGLSQWWNHLTMGSEIGGSGDRLAQDHLEVHNTVSINAGKHLLTAGLQGDIHWFTSRLLSSAWGHYTYASLGSFLANGTPAEYEYRYAVSPGAEEGNSWRAVQLGLFLQDEWKVSPVVSVSGGLRVDVPVFPDRPQENSTLREAFQPLGYTLSTSAVPRTQALASPRIGLTVYPKEDRSFVLKGGVGIFTGRIPYAWIGNLYDRTGLDYVHIKESAHPPRFVADPTRQPMAESDSLLRRTTEVTVASSDFALPQEVRWVFAMEHALPWNLRLSAEALYSRTINGLVFKNLNLKPIDALRPQRYMDERPIYGWSLPLGRWVYSRNDDRFTDVMYMRNGENGESTFLTVQIRRQPADDGIFASLAYTNGSTQDLNSGIWDNAYDQWRYNPAERPNEPRLNFSAFDRSHRIAAAVSYQYEWSPGVATTIGMVYTGTSGAPFSYVYDGDVNGDGESLNDLFYVPGQYNEILLCSDEGNLLIPTDEAYNQLFSFIVHDEYLSSHRRQITERNGARTSWTHQLDLRLAQTLPVFEGHQLEVHAELLNALNLLNPDWGHVEYVPYQIVPILRFYRIDEIGRPWFWWAPRTTPFVSEPLLSRWRFRVGVTYSF